MNAESEKGQMKDNPKFSGCREGTVLPIRRFGDHKVSYFSGTKVKRVRNWTQKPLTQQTAKKRRWQLKPLFLEAWM